MQYIFRPYSSQADQQAMAELVDRVASQSVHVVDLPYRFCSWAFDVPENTGLWYTTDGRLAGWATLQTPFWALDYAYEPFAGRELLAQILAWADLRARVVHDTPSGRPCWFVSVFADQQEELQALEAAGFANQADVGEDSWSKVFLARTAGLPLLEQSVPEGITIRPLAGEQEVAQYVALHRAVFQSTSMTVEWRSRTLGHKHYLPELDLVAANPDGELVAFCVCWLKRAANGSSVGQIEPLGVSEAYAGQGLGRTILTEGLRRLHQRGADPIYVETDYQRNAALHVYELAGFRRSRDIFVYRKDY